MTSRDFCFWLQGYFELALPHVNVINQEQIDIIKKHLNLVFVHEIDPSHGNKEHQEKLNNIHNTTPTVTTEPGVKMRC